MSKVLLENATYKGRDVYIEYETGRLFQLKPLKEGPIPLTVHGQAVTYRKPVTVTPFTATTTRVSPEPDFTDISSQTDPNAEREHRG